MRAASVKMDGEQLVTWAMLLQTPGVWGYGQCYCSMATHVWGFPGWWSTRATRPCIHVTYHVIYHGEVSLWTTQGMEVQWGHTHARWEVRRRWFDRNKITIVWTRRWGFGEKIMRAHLNDINDKMRTKTKWWGHGHFNKDTGKVKRTWTK